MSISRASALPADDSRADAAKAAALATASKARRLSGDRVLVALLGAGSDAFADALAGGLVSSLARALALRASLLVLSAYANDAASAVQVSEISQEIAARLMRTDIKVGKLNENGAVRGKKEKPDINCPWIP
jgi:hypothetical protein